MILQNQHLSIEFTTSPGFGIKMVRNLVNGQVLEISQETLFKYSVDNGPAISSNGLKPYQVTSIRDSDYRLLIKLLNDNLDFSVTISLGDTAHFAVVQCTVANLGTNPVFLRIVMPVLTGLEFISGGTDISVCVPKEMGIIKEQPPANEDQPVSIGSTFNNDIGLPASFNTMELVSIYDASAGGGIYLMDINGNIPWTYSFADDNIEELTVPIQFVYTETGAVREIAGFATQIIYPGQTIALTNFSIGVHDAGDWHKAVDQYLHFHPNNDVYPVIPSWFRDQGAIYTHSTGGAGSIYLTQVPQSYWLIDGATWTAYIPGDDYPSPNNPLSLPALSLPTVPAALAPAGGCISTIKRNDQQLDQFYIGNDGAVWTRFVLRNSDGWQAWVPDPIRLTEAVATPGSFITAFMRSADQMDIFYIGMTGDIETIYLTQNDGKWFWHTIPIVLTNSHRVGTRSLVCLMRDENQLDVLFIQDSAICSVFVARVNGIWGNWFMPVVITGAIAIHETFLTAVSRNVSQVDVFFVGADSKVQTIYLYFINQVWIWQRVPVLLTGPVAFPGSCMAAIMRSDSQLDIFYSDTSGTVQTLFVTSANGLWGAWYDTPIPLTAPNVLLPGASIAAAVRSKNKSNTSLDVFYMDLNGAVCNLHTISINGEWPAWSPAIPLTAPFYVPTGAVSAVARDDVQADVFFIGKGRIKSFEELPQIFKEGLELGTNILYLWDYWDTTPANTYPAYWNKGDYCPRKDLGGEAALKNGIAAVHALGGRILLYLEPFIADMTSSVGKKSGALWEAYSASGEMLTQDPYKGNYKMMPYGPWADYLVTVAIRLVNDYGADGIMLDSMGWQLNRPWKARYAKDIYPEKHVFLSRLYSIMMIELARRIRAEIRGSNGEQVVISETTNLPLSLCTDGAFAADLGFDTIDTKVNALTGSPVRYGYPHINLYSNGTNIFELYQVFAAGHSLALHSNYISSWINDNQGIIAKLVSIRQTYKDALIYGKQLFQPVANPSSVICYLYQSAGNLVLTAVNMSDSPGLIDIIIEIDIINGQGEWNDLRNEGIMHHCIDNKLAVNIPSHELLVLQRKNLPSRFPFL